MESLIPFGRPILDSSEFSLVENVLKSGTLVHGKMTSDFEKEFAERIGVKNAIAVSSCTAGMHLGLFVSEISDGAKVAVPAMTHVATAHVVELQGAKPIFIDVDKRTGNICTKKLKEVASNTKLDAIIPVHYLGLPCEMDEIKEIAKMNNSLIIEDCALSLSATYKNKQTGSLGDLGSFSFYPVKHITSIEGGMVTTNNNEIAKKIRKARAFGYNKALGERSRPGLYDVDALGFNYRMNEIEAAVGLCQLKKLDRFLIARERNYKVLHQKLSNINGIWTFPSKNKYSNSSHYCFNLVLEEKNKFKRNELQDKLKELNIGTSIHYPGAVPLFSYYRKKYNFKIGDFPIAEWLASNTISLSIGPHIDSNQIEEIADKVVNLLS